MFGRKIKKSDYSAFTDVQVIRALDKSQAVILLHQMGRSCQQTKIS